MSRDYLIVQGPGARVVAYFVWIDGHARLLSIVVVRENVIMRQKFIVDKTNT